MNELFEAEQNELLQEDRIKIKSTKDWQTREIERLQTELSAAKSEIKDLQTKISDTIEKFKSGRTSHGWELVNASTAKKIMDGGSKGRVYAILIRDGWLTQVIPACYLPYCDANDNNKIYLHKINEGGYDDC